MHDPENMTKILKEAINKALKGKEKGRLIWANLQSNIFQNPLMLVEIKNDNILGDVIFSAINNDFQNIRNDWNEKYYYILNELKEEEKEMIRSIQNIKDESHYNNEKYESLLNKENYPE